MLSLKLQGTTTTNPIKLNESHNYTQQHILAKMDPNLSTTTTIIAAPQTSKGCTK